MLVLTIGKGIINKVYKKYLNDMTRLQIFFGGSSSGKSFFLAQRVVIDVLNGGRNYLIIRNVSATLKGSVYNEIVKEIARFKVTEYFTFNQTNLIITCVNGYQIIFKGLDNVEKIKSITPLKGPFTDIWIEEATEIDINDFRQLKKRLRGISHNKTKRITLSFNPVLQTHWIHELFFGGWDDNKTEYNQDGVSILKTTYLDNLKHLAQEDIDELENEKDEYFKNVYTYGNWGVLGEVIFRNWSVADLSGMMNQFINRKHGLDFGFATSPSALVCTHYDKNHKTIYIYDELYLQELTNDVLANEVIKKIGYDSVVCDSAEPKSITELKQHDVSALKAKKGKDSVNHGIQWLQQQTIIVGLNCQNAKNELQSYQWRTDSNGNVLPEPIKKYDHLMDALRYAYENEYKESIGSVNIPLH